MTDEEQTYLLDHGTRRMLPEELKALAKLAYLKHGTNSAVPIKAWQNIERMHASPDEKSDPLAALGEETLKQKIAERLFKEHGSEILNTCPRCEKLARTPLAKQCRHCGFDWH